MQAPDVLDQLAKHGLEPSHSTPEALTAYMRREAETWSRIVKEAGIKPRVPDGSGGGAKLSEPAGAHGRRLRAGRRH
jgi:hypothetical protein